MDPDGDPTPGGGDGSSEDPDTNEDDEGTAENTVKNRFRPGFLSQFTDAVGRTLNRKQRDKKTIAQIWLPTLSGLAQSVSFEKLGMTPLSAETNTFLAEYVATLAHRAQSWKREDRSAIAEQEFDRAYQALMERI
jgi:hypothetical protein